MWDRFNSALLCALCLCLLTAHSAPKIFEGGNHSLPALPLACLIVDGHCIVSAILLSLVVNFSLGEGSSLMCTAMLPQLWIERRVRAKLITHSAHTPHCHVSLFGKTSSFFRQPTPALRPMQNRI